MSSDQEEEPKHKIAKLDINDFNGSEDEDSEDDLELISGVSLIPVEQYVFSAFDGGEKIFEMVEKMVQEISILIEKPPSVVWILLNHMKWTERNRFDEAYFGNENKFLQEANVMPPENFEKSECKECEICADDLHTLSPMTCGHNFCDLCWKQYLTEIIEVGGSLRIECPASECKVVVPFDVVQNFLQPNVNIIKKYRRNIANLYIVTNPMTQFCPGAGCDKFVRLLLGLNTSNYKERCVSLACDCGMHFCFHCGRESHAPVACDMLEKWLQMSPEDLDTSSWILENTKRCPKCRTPIEKNGGCHHMRCTNVACRHNFCWNCLGSMDGLRALVHFCNPFADTNNRADRAKLDVKRYKDYYSQYSALHHRSLRLDKKLATIVQKKITYLQNSLQVSWVDVQFLKNAEEILKRSWRTLKYTCCFAYFLKKSNSLEILEDNQTNLEKNTERLLELLQNGTDVTSELNLAALRKSIVEASIYCNSRCDIIIHHVYEGVAATSWTFH